MGSDEAAKVTNGAQHAYGRALVNLHLIRKSVQNRCLLRLELEESKRSSKVQHGKVRLQIQGIEVKRAGERQFRRAIPKGNGP